MVETHFGTLNYIILAAYLGAMILIGVLFSGKQKTTEDYFLAGRNMPWLVVGMSMFASLVSASTYLGVPAIAYTENVAIFFGVLISPIAAPVIIFTFYPFYRRLRVTTSYEYILQRYGARARTAVSGLFVLCRIGWLGVVVYGPALAMSTVTGLPLWLAILLMGLLATAYTVLGGLAAVLWTDAVQFIILVTGAIWVTASLISQSPDGLTGIFQTAHQFGRLAVFKWNLNFFQMTALAAMLNWFLIFMNDYGADQITVQRLMAVKDFKGTAKAVIFNSFSDVLINGMLLFIGLGLLAFYQSRPTSLPAEMQGDRILPLYIMQNLPAGVSGLIITAVFAAAMSSMDSGINSLSTVIVNDFVKPLTRKSRSEKLYVNLARWITVILGAFAIASAFLASRQEHIVAAWNKPLSLFGGPALAMFLLGMLTKKASFPGWIVGAVCSIAATLFVQLTSNPHFAIHWVHYFPLSFGTAFVVGYLASLLCPQKTDIRHLTIWRTDKPSG